VATPSDVVPPGTHLAAELSWDDDDGSHHTQLRILGDDARGYLLMGAHQLAGDREFWFPTLQEAKDEALALGVPRAAWNEVTTPRQVKADVRPRVRLN
jgi:hypothetical protein